MTKILISAIGILVLAISALAQKATNTDPNAAKIVSSDIELFWKAYDKATPENDLLIYRNEYIRKGSNGLKSFSSRFIGNSCNLTDAINRAPKYYAALRTPSLKIMAYDDQMRAGFRRLKEIYPEAVFPDVYFVIGAFNIAGTSLDAGLIIGVDKFGKNEGTPLDELKENQSETLAPIEKIPYVVAHELVHYQQPFLNVRFENLARALKEGGADFVGELISGKNANPDLHVYGDPREKQLWLEFKKEMNIATLFSTPWFYSGTSQDGKPADLGYYVGYKIIENYYKNAEDKKKAVKNIIEIKDTEKFLADSRYEEKFTNP